MKIDKFEKFGMVMYVFIAFSITLLSCVYFYQENTSLIPLSFIPVGMVALYMILSRREHRPIRTIPKTAREFTLTNLGFLILYVAILFLIDGYLHIKVALLILYLMIISFTSWGFVKRNRLN